MIAAPPFDEEPEEWEIDVNNGTSSFSVPLLLVRNQISSLIYSVTKVHAAMYSYAVMCGTIYSADEAVCDRGNGGGLGR